MSAEAHERAIRKYFLFLKARTRLMGRLGVAQAALAKRWHPCPPVKRVAVLNCKQQINEGFFNASNPK